MKKGRKLTSGFDGRFHFDLEGFVAENKLELVGVK